MSPLVFNTPEELQAWRSNLPAGTTVGFVPTMGALHKGHETLLQKSVSENQITVLSIFVNPTQFNDKKDFEKYPLTMEADLALAKKNGVHAVFNPIYSSMYPDDYRYKISENDFSKKLCGKDRPGHFDGVLTVVMKLLNLVQPQKAYFGEKDYQQLHLIQGLVEAFFLPYKIVPVATVREADGLAMSSRNVRLSPTERAWAPKIHQLMKTATTASEAKKILENDGVEVDYLEDLDGRRFAAVRVGEVRLIDNVKI